VTEGKSRPLFVAGVAGGVGTSTWTRAFSSQVRLPVEDLGVFIRYLARINRASGIVDVLVTSNTASATAQLGEVLARCERPPLLVVMHTVPGSIAAARAYLRQAKPHITRRFDVPHQQVWLEMDQPPGRYLPKDFMSLVRAMPVALQEMYSSPPRPPLGPSLTPHPQVAVSGLGATTAPATAPAGELAVRGTQNALRHEDGMPHARRRPGVWR
jgi:hypothetical protein